MSGFPASRPASFPAARGALNRKLAATRNLLAWSEEFQRSAWRTRLASVNADVATAPDGTSSADELIEDDSNDFHDIDQMIDAASEGTFSVYAKQGTGDRHIQLRPQSIGSNHAWATFDLVNGTVGNSGGSDLDDASIVEADNGFWRCSLSMRNPGGAYSYNIILVQSPTASELDGHQGDGSSSVHLWGAQFERGLSLTSYVKTEAN